MPLRCLEYYVHLLYGIVPARFRYRESMYKIPAPEFYVFYNGSQKQKEGCERTMRLSDAFIAPPEEPMCEVKVKFSNIGGTVGKKLPVVQNCAIMKEYCEFMEIVARNRAALGANPPDSELIDCYDKAINEAISKGVLVDYLSRKATEVRNMFFGEYDYDMDIKVHEEVAREQKAIETARNMLKKNYPTSDISEITGLSLEQVLDLQKELDPAQ